MFTKTTLQQILTTALIAIEKNLDALNGLDSAIGDGDHGTAILAAIRAAKNSAIKEGTLAETLNQIGWDIMEAASGSTSSLTGSFYIGMSEAAVSDDLNVDQVITMFESGLSNVQKSTRAVVGDKTLMDALIPAIQAMSDRKGTGDSLKNVFDAAAKAARKGANSTRDMVAKHGRAKNLAQRTIGHDDAGATSTAIIYEAFASCVPQ
ncbi:MAG: dihydroxyacetone kinase subunit L [Thermoguttaceae bacterium]